jgi:ABC-type amino acid transport substrate-binding protein
LKAIHADGTYEKIMKKWGLTDLMLPEPGINLAASNPIPTPTP